MADTFTFQLPAGVGDIVLRVAIIIFAALGIVYLFGRLLPNKLKDKGKNILAVFALFFVSIGTTLAYNPTILDNLSILQYSDMFSFLWEVFLYFAISCVFYVTVGWRFYSRMDSLLDKKIGKDDRRKK